MFRHSVAMKWLAASSVSALLMITLPIAAQNAQAEATPAADSDVTYVVAEAEDGFYTVEIPEGWTLQSATIPFYRLLLPVFVIQSDSPQVGAIGGVVEPALYLEPNDNAAEGDLIEIEGVSYNVAPYIPAADFFPDYLPERYITFDDCTSEPTVEVAEADTEIEPQGNDTYEAINVEWVCESENGLSIATFYGRLGRETVEGVGDLWWVDNVGGVFALEEEYDRTVAIYTHAVNTLTINEEFVANYSSADAFGDALLESADEMGALSAIWGGGIRP